MEILLTFTLKMLDNALGTFKTISISKGKYLSGAIFNALSTFFYLVAIVQMTKSSGLASIVAMCVATFLGTYYPGLIIKRKDGDKLYIYEITASTLESGRKFKNQLNELDINAKTYSCYDLNSNETISFKVFCETKIESKIIEQHIPADFKYHAYAEVLASKSHK